jgi:hypothetical protein
MPLATPDGAATTTAANTETTAINKKMALKPN